MVRIRVVGTPEEVELAVARLRQSFSTVEASAPRPLRATPQQVRVYARCSF
jgi:hypothetical protein